MPIIFAGVISEVDKNGIVSVSFSVGYQRTLRDMDEEMKTICGSILDNK